MICPFCGKEMSVIYIQSCQEIYINQNKPRFNPAGDLKSRRISQFTFTKAPFVKAYSCEECARIIIDLKETKGYEKSTRKRSHRC